MRFLRAQARRLSGALADLGIGDDAVDPARPFVLVAPGAGGARITALNQAAAATGLAVGELLANARAQARGLQARDADPAADATALRRLAVWCLRYSPRVMACDEASGGAGIFIDITGCAHLFGGEAALCADLARRLRDFGLAPRLALAGTAGAAWALAHYGHDGTIVSAGGEAAALRDLPPAALRLDDGTLTLLRSLGFRRIGALIDAPRAPFAARFGEAILRRLDQALGRVAEPLAPVLPPPVYRAQAVFADAIVAQDHVLAAARRLLHAVVRDLERDGKGMKRLRLLLFRVDGGVVPIELGLAAPTRDPGHVARLLALRLDRRVDDMETGAGFEAASLDVLAAAPMVEHQAGFTAHGTAARPDGLARLVDRLVQRFGSGAVRRIATRASHIPERAAVLCPAIEAPPGDWTAAPQGERPPLLFDPPELADVVALIPEGPPRQFRWRGQRHTIVHADGPERIAPEWWRRSRGDAEATRDYYIVEDEAGRRFWIYRAGLYGRETVSPRWFVHGVFP